MLPYQGSVEFCSVKSTGSDCIPDTNLKTKYYPREITHFKERSSDSVCFARRVVEWVYYEGTYLQYVLLGFLSFLKLYSWDIISLEAFSTGLLSVYFRKFHV